MKGNLSTSPALFVCLLLAGSLLQLVTGCSRYNSQIMLEEANTSFSHGSYQASLARYQQIIDSYPQYKDRALFNMGVIYAHPQNEGRNIPKSVEQFHRLVKEHPESPYRHDSQMMISYLTFSGLKDQTIAKQQSQIEHLQQDVTAKEKVIVSLGKRVETLEQKLATVTLRHGSADKILVEKKERRLTLLSRGEVIKRYSIALGGNPSGPKQAEGDNKTPEGTYTIDSRSKDTSYHVSLHISYPNEQDRERAKQLGVSPGGGIMIHGMKSGFGWVGAYHADVNWTQGCIAVTDQEIEEIDRLAPDGITVEIRP